MAESDGYNSPFDYSSDEEEEIEAYLPDDFKQYVDTQLNRCPLVHHDCGFFCGWFFWSREDDHSEHPPSVWDFYYDQSEHPPRGDDSKGDVKGVCEHRMISKDYKFYTNRESSDEQLGAPGRVFNHGFPEFTPNVEHYSIKEYPLRDHALRCQVAQSLAIPLFDLSTHSCVGVLEIVSTTPPIDSLSHYYFDLQEVGLGSSLSVANHGTDINVKKSEALHEISKVLEVAREVHGLHFAQVWALCRVDWICRALIEGDIFHVMPRFDEVAHYELPAMARAEHHLRKGQGVVRRAFYSPNVLLCKDVSQLSIIDYPLAHYARYDKLGCCFAICLQSSCTGNDIHVLECFMPPNNKDYYGNQQTALRKILETMRKNFHTFKLASGEELGGHLYIEEIPFQNGEKLDFVQMSQTTKSLPMLEPLQTGREMTQLDLSNQQSMDALNNESNVVSAERSNIDVTCS
ncbi:hypothetical protein TEA_004461 [Camellia sinensis var. sinensis]|uniref:NLP1-9 GAF domain-containing protein n=1 Tax=Camellia sinensis var. sinensis TaxID=542762 RepID=A0A4S4CX09_CAMSN|nr:hypothetical protein TEA_004461 [Camellia sinensis var. sinensis]